MTPWRANPLLGDLGRRHHACISRPYRRPHVVGLQITLTTPRQPSTRLGDPYSGGLVHRATVVARMSFETRLLDFGWCRRPSCLPGRWTLLPDDWIHT
jgi:hypothetical protein